MESLLTRVFVFLEKHIVFLKATIGILILYAGILLYTYERSFRVHQLTLYNVLQANKREGLFTSQVHVGHDGTTVWFQAVPKEVGTAGPVDYSLVFPGDPFSLNPVFLLIMISVFVLILILVLIFQSRNKKQARSE